MFFSKEHSCATAFKSALNCLVNRHIAYVTQPPRRRLARIADPGMLVHRRSLITLVGCPDKYNHINKLAIAWKQHEYGGWCNADYVVGIIGYEYYHLGGM